MPDHSEVKWSLHRFIFAGIMFRAEERPFGDPEEDHAGWTEFALGGVETHAIPGVHETILTDPNVRSVAKVIQACLSSTNRTIP